MTLQWTPTDARTRKYPPRKRTRKYVIDSGWIAFSTSGFFPFSLCFLSLFFLFTSTASCSFSSPSTPFCFLFYCSFFFDFHLLFSFFLFVSFLYSIFFTTPFSCSSSYSTPFSSLISSSLSSTPVCCFLSCVSFLSFLFFIIFLLPLVLVFRHLFRLISPAVSFLLLSSASAFLLHLVLTRKLHNTNSYSY